MKWTSRVCWKGCRHYFTTVTRRGRTRRLHRFGSCPAAPGTYYNRLEDYGEDVPPPEKYIHGCVLGVGHLELNQFFRYQV